MQLHVLLFAKKMPVKRQNDAIKENNHKAVSL